MERLKTCNNGMCKVSEHLTILKLISSYPSSFYVLKEKNPF